MSSMTVSTSLSDREASLLSSLASRFSVDSNEQAHLQDDCKLSESERGGHSHPGTAQAVGIAKVSTLVCTGKSALPGASYVVPTFAVHWGIIVRRTLFHLRYNSQTRSVKFSWQPWDVESDSRHKVDSVGTTKYNTDDLIHIGIPLPYKFIKIRGKAYRGFWRLSQSVLELSDFCKSVSSSNLRRAQDRVWLLDLGGHNFVGKLIILLSFLTDC
jgi:hypothetical protein